MRRSCPCSHMRAYDPARRSHSGGATFGSAPSSSSARSRSASQGHEDGEHPLRTASRALGSGPGGVAVSRRTARRAGARVPETSGGEWSDSDWRNWRKRVFAPAALAVGLEPPALRPPALVCFVSPRRGCRVVEVAGQAGPLTDDGAEHLRPRDRGTQGAERTVAEEAIRQARDELVPLTYPRSRRTKPPRRRTPICGTSREADARTRTADPFITSEVLYQLSYVGGPQG